MDIIVPITGIFLRLAFPSPFVMPRPIVFPSLPISFKPLKAFGISAIPLPTSFAPLTRSFTALTRPLSFPPAFVISLNT